MSKYKFDAESFKTQNQKVKDGGGEGDFPIIEKGVYLTEVSNASLAISSNGAERISIHFKIDSEDEKYAGQVIFWNQTFVNTNGEQNAIGQTQTCMMLTKLSDGHFDPDDFIKEPNLCLEKFLGTEVKVKINPKTTGKYTDSQLEIVSVIQSVYSADAKPDKFEDEVVSPAQAEIKSNEADIIKGMTVSVDGSDGTEWEGTVLALIDDKEKGPMFLIQELKKPSHTEQVTASQLIIYDDEEEEEEEEEVNQEITVGCMVDATFKGEKFSGEVTAIEDNKIKVRYNGKLRTCKKENCTLQVPF